MEDAKFLARPSKAQYEWQDMEIGMFVHWFPEIFPPEGTPDDHPGDHRHHSYECIRVEQQAGQWDIERQKEVASWMDCPDYDPDQWVQSAIDLGAKYIVFVAKHGTGICRWQSEYGGMNFKYARYKDGKGDPLGELAEACRKRGIKLGVYLNGRTVIMNTADRGITYDPDRQEDYNEMYRGWLTEVLSKYGDMVEVWYDGSLNLEVGDILKKYAKNAMIFQSKFANIRWVGNEEGTASDPVWNAISRIDAVSGVSTEAQSDPDGDTWMPYECDTTLRDQWGYNMVTKNELYSVEQLMDKYYSSVGHGVNLLINHAPNGAGRIEEEDMKRMKEFGDEIRRRFGHPIAETSGEGEIVELDLGKKQKIDHVVTMEEIAYGHRIRSYMIEGYDGEKWIRLATGISVGHKKIDYFEAEEVEKVRIRVTTHVGEPLIRSITAFYCGVTPKLHVKTKFNEFKLCDYGYASYDINTLIATMDFDVTPYVTVAGQYRIWFRDEDVNHFEIDKIWLESNGMRVDEYLKRTDDPLVFDVFAPGGADSLKIHVTSKPRKEGVNGVVIFARVD